MDRGESRINLAVGIQPQNPPVRVKWIFWRIHVGKSSAYEKASVRVTINGDWCPASIGRFEERKDVRGEEAVVGRTVRIIAINAVMIGVVDHHDSLSIGLNDE